jgi:hypothetical protein
VGQLEKIR